MFKETLHWQETQQPTTDFLDWLIFHQVVFETERVGTDGSLYEMNTVEHMLTRGVIGEAQEALEEAKNGNQEALKEEIIDVIISLGSVLMHAGMTPTEIIELVARKINTMHKKYNKEHFTGRPVKEALLFSREIYQKD